jgi:integrase
MTTLVTPITNKNIKLNENSVTVTKLRDPKTSLYFHYSKANREKGAFYTRLYMKGTSKSVRIGQYPKISSKKAHLSIPNIHLREGYFFHNELSTMKQLCNWYITRVKSNRQIKSKTAKQTVALINNHIKPYLCDFLIDEIDEGKIDQHWFTPIQNELALSTIDLAVRTLNAMFTWAKKLKMLSKNPVENLSISGFTHQRPEIKACRLSDLKLQYCFKKLNELPVHKQLLLVMITLHGTRIGETTKACWSAFDFDNYLWRIPASDTKTNKSHVLPLSPIAVDWLKAYKCYQYKNNRSKYLFPQKANRRKPQSANTGSRIIGDIAGGEWTAHDIRKYSRSSWLENGVDYIIGELLLNHSLSKLDQSYIQTTAMN